MVSLENLNNPSLFENIKRKIKPIAEALEKNEFKTVFVFGDGFGENNHNLIGALSSLINTYPLNIIGGMTGRSQVKASHFTIFTPEKMIQNGAVLAFAAIESSIGVEHGWIPLMDSELEITQINDCFVEEINGCAGT